MVAMRIRQESTPLANVHPQNGGLRPRRARRRGSRALGWLATGALLIAEALAAVVLVIVGLGLFARVHVASQASVESLVAAPLMEPRLSDRQTMRPIPAPSDQRIERPGSVRRQSSRSSRRAAGNGPDPHRPSDGGHLSGSHRSGRDRIRNGASTTPRRARAPAGRRAGRHRDSPGITAASR
jgi:hypothetical protein